MAAVLSPYFKNLQVRLAVYHANVSDDTTLHDSYLLLLCSFSISITHSKSLPVKKKGKKGERVAIQ